MCMRAASGTGYNELSSLDDHIHKLFCLRLAVTTLRQSTAAAVTTLRQSTATFGTGA